jgi:hypothetical protein
MPFPARAGMAKTAAQSMTHTDLPSDETTGFLINFIDSILSSESQIKP